MAEYYFDYKLSVLSDGLNIGDSGLPQLHIERDYIYSDDVKYVMYLTFPQWDAVKGGTREKVQFDVAKVVFDIRGIGIETVVKDNDEELEKNKVEINTTMEYDKYKGHGFRFAVVSDAEDYSGVGKIILKKANAKMETVIYFAVNFAFKKKLRYHISGDKIVFDGKNIKDEIEFQIHYADDRYPCLKQDGKSNAVRLIKVDFSVPASKTVFLQESLKGRKIYVSFAPSTGDSLEKYYLLECTGNDTLGTEKRDFARQDIETHFCPYCHNPIETGVGFQGKYKQGGVACNGHRIYDGGKPIALLNGKDKGKKAKNAMYCAEDFGTEKVNNHDVVKKPNAGSPFARLLPEHFFAHNHFKVVVVGSKRAGKTTFLSRLFDVSGQNLNTELSAKMLVNGTKKSFTLAPYTIKEMDTKTLAISRNSWYKKTKFYSKYSIDAATGLYPDATDKMDESQADKARDVMRYPFVLESNKDSYVYFYDIAGEDAEQSTNRLTKMMTNAPVGVFYLVDGRANTMGNDRVFQRIREVIEEHKDVPYPIAIILTKFDMLEEEFDENCHCLRSDVYDMMGKTYEGSQLEQNIDLASEEIKSYLKRCGMNPDFGGNVNVRYFGVSSFADPNAVFHMDQTATSPEINYLTHTCSSKRMELPVIWMLKQFGCIV